MKKSKLYMLHMKKCSHLLEYLQDVALKTVWNQLGGSPTSKRAPDFCWGFSMPRSALVDLAFRRPPLVPNPRVQTRSIGLCRKSWTVPINISTETPVVDIPYIHNWKPPQDILNLVYICQQLLTQGVITAMKHVEIQINSIMFQSRLMWDVEKNTFSL